MELCRSKQTPYPKDEQVNISPVLFRIVDFANTSANLHLHENHNKKKRWRGMRLHFPDINGTRGHHQILGVAISNFHLGGGGVLLHVGGRI